MRFRGRLKAELRTNHDTAILEQELTSRSL